MDQQENTPWQYKPDDGAPAPDLPDDSSNGSPATTSKTSKPVTWQAPEFIEHHHPASWYGALGLVTLALVAVIFVTTRDYFAAGVMLVLGVIVGVFAGHKPSQATYDISRGGLSVNGKTYPFSSFKSFAVLREGPLSSINLFPLKRFMPPIAAYFEPADEQKIVDALGNYLPYEERKLDGIDRLSRRLRL